MTPLDHTCVDAVKAAFRGHHVAVNREQYQAGVRAKLVEAVRVLVGMGDEAGAERVMDEILRLDLEHGIEPQRRSA